MLDFTIISAAPIGFLVFGILATLLVAISKAGFGGAMGSLSLPLMLLVLSTRPRPVGLAAGFSVVRFLCRLEILPPSRAPHCHRHDFGRLFGASLGLAAL